MTLAAQDSLHAIVQEDTTGTQRVERPGYGDPVIITRSGGPEHGRELTRPRGKEVSALVGSLSVELNLMALHAAHLDHDPANPCPRRKRHMPSLPWAL